MTEQMNQECMRLFNEMTKLQSQQGQIIITQAQMLAELKTLVAAQYLQLNNRVDQVEKDVAPLAWVKWVTLVIGGVLVAQAIANIFD